MLELKIIVRGVGRKVRSDVVDDVESDEDGSIGLYVGGEVGPRDVISVGKYCKGWVDVRISEIVCSGVVKDVGTGIFRCIDGEINIPKIYLVWMLITV